jgi:hypothetical protein
VDDWLATLEAMSDDERWAALAYVAGQQVELDSEELRGPVRRALLLLAAGGDPRREVALESRAVLALAEELDDPAHREELQLGIASLRELGKGRPAVAEAIVVLLASPDLAWRCFAAALLAAELADDDGL